MYRDKPLMRNTSYFDFGKLSCFYHIDHPDRHIVNCIRHSFENCLRAHQSSDIHCTVKQHNTWWYPFLTAAALGFLGYLERMCDLNDMTKQLGSVLLISYNTNSFCTDRSHCYMYSTGSRVHEYVNTYCVTLIVHVFY